MRYKNSIKSPKQDSLRGIGKLGWTEGSKLHKVVKNLISTFNNEPNYKSKKNKNKVKCPRCGKKFNLVNGKIPQHTIPDWRYSYNWALTRGKKELCDQKSQYRPNDPPKIIGKVEEFDIPAGKIKVGDIIVFTIIDWKKYYNNTKDFSTLYYGKITSLNKYTNIYPSTNFTLDRYGDKLFPANNLTSNLIFLTEEEYKQYETNTN